MSRTAPPRRRTVASAGHPASPSDAAVRIVYQALRTLVADEDVVTLPDLTTVTRLTPGEASAAMNRLVRCGPVAVSRYAAEEPPAWHVCRTDR